MVGMGKTTTNDGLVLMHIQWMRGKGLAEGTIRARKSALKRLERFTEATPAGATRSHVESYLALRRTGDAGRVVSDSTFANEVSHLRGFFAWLHRFEYRMDDPMSRVEAGRRYTPMVQPIPDPTLSDVLKGADGDLLVILALAAFAGLRACEIASLSWADVDGVDATIHVRRGKNGKDRMVPLTQPVRDALTALPHRSGQVVRRRDGSPRPVTPNLVTKRAGRVLGGRKSGGFSLHQLRHRWASAAYRESKDIRAVQEGLGHSSPATTAIYAKPGADALREASEAASTLRLGESRAF